MSALCFRDVSFLFRYKQNSIRFYIAFGFLSILTQIASHPLQIVCVTCFVVSFISQRLRCLALPTCTVLEPLLTFHDKPCFNHTWHMLSVFVRPHQVKTTVFILCICYIYALGFGQYWTLFCSANLSTPNMPYMWFLFVRPRLCRQLSLDFASQWTLVSLAIAVLYYQVCSGFAPLSCCLC
jgi:hypothetical protein